MVEECCYVNLIFIKLIFYKSKTGKNVCFV